MKSRWTQPWDGSGSGPPALAGTPSTRPGSVAVQRASSARKAASAICSRCAVAASSRSLATLGGVGHDVQPGSFSLGSPVQRLLLGLADRDVAERLAVGVPPRDGLEEPAQLGGQRAATAVADDGDEVGLCRVGQHRHQRSDAVPVQRQPQVEQRRAAGDPQLAVVRVDLGQPLVDGSASSSMLRAPGRNRHGCELCSDGADPCRGEHLLRSAATSDPACPVARPCRPSCRPYQPVVFPVRPRLSQAAGWRGMAEGPDLEGGRLLPARVFVPGLRWRTPGGCRNGVRVAAQDRGRARPGDVRCALRAAARRVAARGRGTPRRDHADPGPVTDAGAAAARAQRVDRTVPGTPSMPTAALGPWHPGLSALCRGSVPADDRPTRQRE